MRSAGKVVDTEARGEASAALDHWLRQEEEAGTVVWPVTEPEKAARAGPEGGLPGGWWIVPILISALPAWAALLMWIF